ncbi:hypothetical protein JOB18_000554 [Solea senegalensis]|uniref:Uncharacterized protein n=1 Tax=Solea senegalensis TaxID=28829 RepID=A0AAV6SLH8_SOLSE|nr:hypothetical protein JOB18_000554 [Solea senegalensis]
MFVLHLGFQCPTDSVSFLHWSECLDTVNYLEINGEELAMASGSSWQRWLLLQHPPQQSHHLGRGFLKNCTLVERLKHKHHPSPQPSFNLSLSF